MIRTKCEARTMSEGRLCLKICERYKAKRPKDFQRYNAGQVYCNICAIWMTRDGCILKDGRTATIDSTGISCKCCNYRVRARPRSRKSKSILKK